jgi:hypothetical protein
MIVRTHLPFVLALLFLSACGPLAAQRGFPENCRGMLTATLASGRTHGDLRSCAPFLIPEAVSMLNAASDGNDPARLADVLTYASKFRDGAVFDAALRLANDRAATPRARVLGLLVAYSLVEPSFWPSPPRDPEQHFTDLAPEKCVLWSAWLTPPYWVDNGLPPDHLARLLAITKQLSGDAQTPALVRGIAGCAPFTLETLIRSRSPS